MLQIKNTLGGGKPEGLYAWKKSSVACIDSITTHTRKNYTLGNATSDTTVYYSTSYTLDETTGTYTLVNPKSATLQYAQWGIYSVEMVKSNYYIWGSTSSNEMYTTNASSTYNVYLKNSDGEVHLESDSANYKYDIHSAKIEYTFIDYVVSDKETAYPDGGLHTDGYRYDKISNLKFTFGTFTPTSNQQETTIVHGLNDKIRFFGIYTEHIKPTESSLYQVEALSLHRGITYASNGTSRENYNGRVSITYVLTAGPYWYDDGFKISSLYGIGDVTESSITIFKNNSATSDNSSGSTNAPYFIGGRVHKWIAIADWEV